MVVFDLDGTLYVQRPVRIAMAAELLVHALGRLSTRDAKALSRFRALREEYADRGEVNFEAALLAEAGAPSGHSAEEMRVLVHDWMEMRPLRHLERARVAGAAEAFDVVRKSGRRVAVWSDYPVAHKLRALGLKADLTASATDPEIARLKPDPAGLLWLCGQAGVPPAETLMIGDRIERDGEAARRAGALFLLRSARRDGPFAATVVDYRDPMFQREAIGCAPPA